MENKSDFKQEFLRRLSLYEDDPSVDSLKDDEYTHEFDEESVTHRSLEHLNMKEFDSTTTEDCSSRSSSSIYHDESATFCVVGEGSVPAKRVSFRSLTPSQVDLTDQRMMMELRLLDAISGSPPNRRSFVSIASSRESLQSTNSQLETSPFVEAPSDFLDPPKNFSRRWSLFPFGKPRRISRKHKIFGAFIVFIVAVLVIALILVLIVWQCELLGCSNDKLYARLSSLLISGTNATFSPGALNDFPQISDLNSYLLSTYPAHSSENISRNSWKLINITQPSSFSSFDNNTSTVVNKTHALSLGEPICGRLSYSSPILGLLPSTNGIGTQFSHSFITSEIRISNFTNTALSPNTTASNNSAAEIKDTDLPLCCVEFVFLGNANNIKPSDVNMRLVCQTGPGVGGYWDGWNNIVTWPNTSWVKSVKTGGYVQLSQPIPSTTSAITTISVSGVSDVTLNRGITVQARASLPNNIFPGFQLFIVDRYSIGAAVESRMSTSINFQPKKFIIDPESALFTFTISSALLDFSKLVPSPFVSTDNECSIAVSTVGAIENYRIAFGSQFVTFGIDGCPYGYQFYRSLCWANESKFLSKSSVFIDHVFTDPAQNILEFFNIDVWTKSPINATIARIEFAVSMLNVDSPITRANVDFKLRLNSLNQTKKARNISNPGKFYLMVDGSINDNSLGEPMSAPIDLSVQSLDYEFVGLSQRLGGEWVEIELKNGIFEDTPWNEISPIFLKTSGRSGSLLIAFVPSNDFTKSGMDIDFQFLLQNVPNDVANPVEVSLSQATDSLANPAEVIRVQAAIRALEVETLNAMINGIANVVNVNEFQAISSYSDYSFLTDSLLASGIGAPSNDSLEPAFGVNNDNLEIPQYFTLPLTNNDILPPQSFNVWNVPQESLINDTFGMFDYQKLAQSLLKVIRNELQKVYINEITSVSQIVLDSSFQATLNLVETPGDRNITNLRKSLKLLATTFFSALEPAAKYSLPYYLRFFGLWMLGDFGINSDQFPDPVYRADVYFSHYAKQNSVASGFNSKSNPFDTLTAISAVDFTYFTNPNITAGANQSASESIIVETFSDDFIFNLRNSSNKIAHNDGTIVYMKEGVFSITEARSIYSHFALDKVLQLCSRLLRPGHPLLFPHEILLPETFSESPRKDFEYAATYIDEWVTVQTGQRNEWMTWASLKTIAELTKTSKINYDFLVSQDRNTSKIETNLPAWILPMSAVANLQFSAPYSNWTLLTWAELKVIEILEMASSFSVSDNELLDSMVEFSTSASSSVLYQ